MGASERRKRGTVPEGALPASCEGYNLCMNQNANDKRERRGADGEPLVERGTIPSAQDDADREAPVDETDDGPAPTIAAEDAKYA